VGGPGEIRRGEVYNHTEWEDRGELWIRGKVRGPHTVKELTRGNNNGEEKKRGEQTKGGIGEGVLLVP